jgi:hypothetical protein
MTGTISPVRPPPSPDCRLWWADVTATKVTASAALDPTEGPREKKVTVTGRGWEAGHGVDVEWDDGTG